MVTGLLRNSDEVVSGVLRNQRCSDERQRSRHGAVYEERGRVIKSLFVLLVVVYIPGPYLPYHLDQKE